MRRIIFVSILITVLALFTALSGAAVVDKIVVVVNNEIITQREVDVILAPIYGQYRSMYKGEELIRMLEDAREKILKQLIEDRLIFSEAKKLNITIDEKEIDARVDEVRNKVGSERDLENMLHEQNLTLNELRARYKEKIMIRKLVDQKVGAKIIITPLEVKDYYNDNKESFMQPEEIKLRTILIKPRKEQGGEAGSLQLMRDLVKRLKEGCDFEELAKEYS
ncbi:MAG: SurA N-terminal domain-containing protein, partial [Candidatus Omnitrophota bacterium]